MSKLNEPSELEKKIASQLHAASLIKIGLLEDWSFVTLSMLLESSLEDASELVKNHKWSLETAVRVAEALGLRIHMTVGEL